VQVTIGTADEKLTANKDVEQRILICNNAQESPPPSPLARHPAPLTLNPSPLAPRTHHFTLTLTLTPHHAAKPSPLTLTPTPTLTNAQEKDHHLIQQINTLSPGSRVLIFCSTKRMCVPGLAPPPHPTVHAHAHALTHTRTCR